MAIAVNGGHVSRAIDFYDRENKYLIIGGSKPWDDEPDPDMPKIEDFKLRDVIGLKKLDNTFFVIPDNSDRATIVYRDQKWRVVPKEINTVVGDGGVVNNSDTFDLESVEGLSVGSKIRINNLYEGFITEMNGNTITIDTLAPATIPAGSPVIGGALVENAKYVYIEGYLEYDRFPLTTYRQIGLCTGVVPADPSVTNVLRSAEFNPAGVNEYSSLGVLEILDNRSPIPRDINMRERISMIIEF